MLNNIFHISISSKKKFYIMARKYTYRKRKSAATLAKERAQQAEEEAAKEKRMKHMSKTIDEMVDFSDDDSAAEQVSFAAQQVVAKQPKRSYKKATRHSKATAKKITASTGKDLIHLREIYDETKLSIIVDNFNDIASKEYTDLDYADVKRIKKLLQKYLFNGSKFDEYKIDSNTSVGIINTEYYQPKDNARQTARNACSLQAIIRNVRHTISSEFYNDIDMVNAHPIILQHLCKKNNFAHHKLDDYINNREKHIADMIKKCGIDRDEAKKTFLAIMNGGVADYYKYVESYPFLIEFKKEMSSLHKLFTIDADDRYSRLKKKRTNSDKDYNHEGAYMNLLMLDMENKILMSMYEFYGKPTNAVLCYDGIMLLKEVDTQLKKCEEHILEDTGVNINLKVKPMDSIINLTSFKSKPILSKSILLQGQNGQKDKIQISIDSMNKVLSSLVTEKLKSSNSKTGASECLTAESREVFIKFLRQTMIHTFNGGKEAFYCKEIQYDHKTKSSYEVWTKMDLERIFRNRDFVCSSKPQWSTRCSLQKVGQIIEHVHCALKDIPRYHRSTFQPYLKNVYDNPDIYNEWNGFVIQQHEDDRVDKLSYDEVKKEFEKTKIYFHIANNICDNNKELLDWNLKHEAHLFQYPDEKPDVCRIFYSQGGAGKDMYAQFLANMIGANYCRVQCGLKSLNSNFNAYMKAALLCVYNEVDAKSSHQNHDMLKHIITQQYEKIEPKGIDADIYPCFKRIIINTNYRDIVKIESDDRRYVYFAMNNEYIGNFKFFKELHKEITNKSILKLAFRYFSEMDIDKFWVRNIPKTQYKKTQIDLNLRSTVKYMRALCDVKYLEDNNLLDLKKYAIYKDLPKKEDGELEDADDEPEEEQESDDDSNQNSSDSEDDYEICCRKDKDIIGYHIKSGDFFDYYKKYCEDQETKSLKKSIFKVDTQQILGDNGTKRFKAECSAYSTRIRGYDINIDTLKKTLMKTYKLEF
jgi:hypothetical protein